MAKFFLKNLSKIKLKLSLLLLFLALATSGCAFSLQKKPKPTVVEPIGIEEPAVSTPETENYSGRMKRFNDYNELAEFLRNNNSVDDYGAVARDLVLSGGATRTAGVAAPAAAPVAESASSQNLAADSGGTTASTPNNALDYSATNNQVVGVDEADIIKTDGEYIFALVRNELSIIKAVPAGEATVISKITFKSRPQDIFIQGDFLAVFGADDQIYAQPLYATFRRQSPYTFFKVFDVSDPSDPKQVRDLDFEGTYRDARLIGDYVYLLTDTYANYILDEPVVPRLIENGQVLATNCDTTAKCFAPEVYYFDIPYDYYNFTNITAINMASNGEAVSGQSYLLDSSQNIYVSQDNIYLTYTQYLNEYDLEQEVKKDLVYLKLAAAEQDKIKAIETAADFILTKNEKKYKIAQIVDRYLNSLDKETAAVWQTEIDSALEQKLFEKSKEMEKTIIHKIAVKGRRIDYAAMGEVNGQLLNQFSMDESGEYFRLATTRNRQWSRLETAEQDSYSNIYVLDKDLKLVGALENLATTERIYAARFIGARVYLVTFKQVDPLFVISLSDPSTPKVLGAIKIPGFSNYLHPIDKDGNKLLGLGRDTEVSADGGVKIKGLKLSLFDFTDLGNPKELDSYLIGDSRSDSIALYDHKAFLYSAEKNILSIPAVLHDGQGRLSFAGALVFSLNDNSLEEKGRIDHSAGGNFTQADYWRGYSYYDNTVKRSLYIGDNLYTFSNKFLKINNLDSLVEAKSLELTAGGYDYIITPMPAVDGEVDNSSSPAFPGGESSPGLPDEGIFPGEPGPLDEGYIITEEVPAEPTPPLEEYPSGPPPDEIVPETSGTETAPPPDTAAEEIIPN
jgi:uncharacterized secreted protein with C-terminal beta-propeller domain